jgi:hypothetical protein
MIKKRFKNSTSRGRRRLLINRYVDAQHALTKCIAQTSSPAMAGIRNKFLEASWRNLMEGSITAEMKGLPNSRSADITCHN